MKARLGWLIALVLIVALVVVVSRASRKTPVVDVATATVSDISGSFTAEGVVKGKEYNLSPEAAGRIIQIDVKEGDAVKVGQVLLRIDTSQAETSVRQAEAAVRTAETGVREARASFSLVRDQIEARVTLAAAKVRAARASYERVKKGPRTQEIEVAEHRLEQLQATAQEARLEFERAESLFKEGAIAKANLDGASTRLKTAQGEVEAQKDALALLRAGASREELLEAKSTLEGAEAEYAGALKGRDELKVRASAVAGAMSRAQEATEALNQARAALPKFVLKAPVDGTVTRLYVELGTMAGPSAAALTLATRQDLHVEAEIGSEDAAKANTGMPVTVTTAAYPGRKFPGRIERLSTVGELKPDAAIRTRIIRARVSLNEGFPLFKPGVEVDVEGTAVLKRALVVPSDAVVYEGVKTSIWVVSEGTASTRVVKVGFASVDLTEILEGLRSGEVVVVRGKEGLRDGGAVKVRR